MPAVDDLPLFEAAARYPQAPGFRRRDTAADAAAEMRGRAGTLRAECLGVLTAAPGGLTADEVAGRLRESVLSIRPRITELSAMGRIVDSGLRRANASGRNAIVWRVKP